MHPVIVLDVFDSSILTTVDKRIMRTEARGRRASIPKVRAFRSAWACQPKDAESQELFETPFLRIGLIMLF